ncbi:hypothetical protein B0A49_03484 [Cryomyces minteri]|uniref:TM7S3/TM198-like domain-containing protein n=1 Tax=Cryomyces minteri TaxID=331657 RepID=A0A4U0X6Y9_9PEZI|nr:hypothetical protein B0A49_03484 [Cryomyces minteri]
MSLPLPVLPASLQRVQAIVPITVVDTHKLPIQPKITPAIGIVGAVLLATGSAYALVGIKHRWMYIFLSTAFLTSLSVLVVYVMNPPVSDAIQGAYFVAACMTGLIFSAISLVFTKITEGLGCLLGGFCLSMWFLVLKPGGLITSVSGRAILISIFCLLSFSLAFSNYTRTYGLICSISLAGATITVLGVDCFSRAGLKEFWLYIWSLNDNLFPLGTNTYPITRGIRVEIVATVLIFLLGIASQMKLWKLVRERRERLAAERLQEDEDRQNLEASVGRRIEEDNERDRAEWEAVYGDKEAVGRSHADSGVGSSAGSMHKGSISIREGKTSASNDIEMADFDRSTTGNSLDLMSKNESRNDGRASVTVRVISEDSVQRKDSDSDRIPLTIQGSSDPTARGPSQELIARGSSEGTPRKSIETRSPASKRSSPQVGAPPPPMVVPLPFSPPLDGEDDDDSDKDETASAAMTAESTYKRRRISGKVSRGLKRLSIIRDSSDADEGFESQEALFIPHVEIDRASSVVATVDDISDDDLMSLPKFSPMPSPYDVEFPRDIQDPRILVTGTTTDEARDTELNQEDLADQTYTGSENSSEGSLGRKDLGHVTEPKVDPKAVERQPTDPAAIVVLTSSTNPKPMEVKARRTSRMSQHRTPGVLSTDQEQTLGCREYSKAPEQDASSAEEETKSLVGSLKEHLPALSKVAMVYRTNEWAKHLAAAERPDLDDLGRAFSPGMRVDHGFAEAAAPVHVEELQQIAAAQASTNSVQTSRANPHGRNQNAFAQYSESTMPDALSRSPSGTSMHGITQRLDSTYSTRPRAATASSQPRVNTWGVWNVSTPLVGETLIESPIEEVLQASAPYRNLSAPSTLLGKRDDIMANRVTSTSFNQLPYTSNLSVVSPSITASSHSVRPGYEMRQWDEILHSERKQLLDEDNMTLAQRKDLIQRQNSRLSRNPYRQRQESWLVPQTPQQGAIYTSNQPRRTSAAVDLARREAVLATWRDSVRADLTANQPLLADEGRRQAMLGERRQAALWRQQAAMEKGQKESEFDAAMRKGEMLNLHKEALRKMQASASRNA